MSLPNKAAVPNFQVLKRRRLERWVSDIPLVLILHPIWQDKTAVEPTTVAGVVAKGVLVDRGVDEGEETTIPATTTTTTTTEDEAKRCLVDPWEVEVEEIAIAAITTTMEDAAERVLVEPGVAEVQGIVIAAIATTEDEDPIRSVKHRWIPPAPQPQRRRNPNQIKATMAAETTIGGGVEALRKLVVGEGPGSRLYLAEISRKAIRDR
mmetsp:Transcript_10608/g.19015  ORF Transcript_10608/g.19015 Transcript_10608/m.19015 type:complete len:208 (-) Transcript_10608:257-880(-)